MNTKGIRKQLAAAIAMLLVATIALGSSTFAWFINNSKVTMEAADYTATTANYLLISDDNQNWGTSMELAKLNEGKTMVPVSAADSAVLAGDFFKVKEEDKDAWSANKAQLFVEAVANEDYVMDTFSLKSSQTQTPDVKFTITGDTDHLSECMYVAVVQTKATPKEGTADTTAKVVGIYPINSTGATVTGGANTGSTWTEGQAIASVTAGVPNFAAQTKAPVKTAAFAGDKYAFTELTKDTVL